MQVKKNLNTCPFGFVSSWEKQPFLHISGSPILSSKTPSVQEHVSLAGLLIAPMNLKSRTCHNNCS
jgi:hypothetical protein